jgi:hypothetical protein
MYYKKGHGIEAGFILSLQIFLTSNDNSFESTIFIQGDSRVIMILTKFVMQPTIHVPHKFFSLCFY